MDAYDALVHHQIQVDPLLLSRSNGMGQCLPDNPLPHPRAQNGVEGLIVGGTTGEGQLMSWDEHVMLIAHTGVSACAAGPSCSCRHTMQTLQLPVQ